MREQVLPKLKVKREMSGYLESRAHQCPCWLMGLWVLKVKEATKEREERKVRMDPAAPRDYLDDQDWWALRVSPS